MVRPSSLEYNTETPDNTFQTQMPLDPSQVRSLANREFQELATNLIESGVAVEYLDSPEGAPDAVFPNNWFSIHEDGLLILYPMKAANRRRERQVESLKKSLKHLGFEVKEILDLYTTYEAQGEFLEGTGSLVLDRDNRVVYASISERTSPNLAKIVAQKLGYELVLFQSMLNGVPIYHTNVLLSIGSRFAAVCLDVVTEGREALESALERSEKQIIKITTDELKAYCGNIIELRSSKFGSVLVMSGSAHKAFNRQIKLFEALGCKVVKADLTTIEAIGGGSARCMLAEAHF